MMNELIDKRVSLEMEMITDKKYSMCMLVRNTNMGEVGEILMT
jgi:hypothetical protein